MPRVSLFGFVLAGGVCSFLQTPAPSPRPAGQNGVRKNALRPIFFHQIWQYNNNRVQQSYRIKVVVVAVVVVIVIAISYIQVFVVVKNILQDENTWWLCSWDATPWLLHLPWSIRNMQVPLRSGRTQKLWNATVPGPHLLCVWVHNLSVLWPCNLRPSDLVVLDSVHTKLQRALNKQSNNWLEFQKI